MKGFLHAGQQMAKADDLFSPCKTMIYISKSIFKEMSEVLENNLGFYLRAVSINIMDGQLAFYHAWVNAQKYQWASLLVMENFKCQGT